jgi:phosphinothricin acetyltransferase
VDNRLIGAFRVVVVTALNFRPATTADAPALVNIYNHYVTASTVTFDLDAWTIADMEHKIESVAKLSMPFIVAEMGGDVVGYGYLSTWRDKCAYETTMENTLYLREDSRGRGIGRSLLDEIVRLGAESGVREIIAVISDSDDAIPSIRLHEKAGFARVGEMANVGRKFDEWLGVVMLQKSLV